MPGVQMTAENNLGGIRIFIWEDVILQVMGYPAFPLQVKPNHFAQSKTIF